MKYPCMARPLKLGCYTALAMRRWILMFLLVLLPMQLSWAAVASYCQHESGTAATTQHFGHHEHQHSADVAPDAIDHGDTSTEPTGTGAIDVDCGTCHAGCSTPVLQSLTLVMAKLPSALHSTSAVHLSSQPASLPERPNWAHLA